MSGLGGEVLLGLISTYNCCELTIGTAKGLKFSGIYAPYFNWFHAISSGFKGAENKSCGQGYLWGGRIEEKWSWWEEVERFHGVQTGLVLFVACLPVAMAWGHPVWMLSNHAPQVMNLFARLKLQCKGS